MTTRPCQRAGLSFTMPLEERRLPGPGRWPCDAAAEVTATPPDFAVDGNVSRTSSLPCAAAHSAMDSS